jgi:uncharacterized protein YndB with AHSA1/START domain
MVVKNKSNELKVIRILDAPLKAVWQAWTDPEQLAQWWGPRGFTITTHSRDFKPGGHWHYTMHGPDGVDYVNKTKYLEVEDEHKMVYDHGGGDETKPLFRVTVLFSESGGKTKMDMTMTLPTPEAAEQTRKFVKKAGGESTWDRLSEYMEKTVHGKEKFVINRTFDASIDLMFAMWTEAKHLGQWLAPTGAEVDFIRADIKPGGSSFYCMTVPGGGKMYGRADYLEIKKPDHIVYSQQFCDENEKVTRHPMSPTWPETMLTTVQLSEEGPDRTRVTLTWEPFGAVTKEEMETFVQARSGMTQGWTGSLDKLEEVLAACPV